MRVNYQKKLEEWIEELEKEGRRASLLLHSCCAPCSSYVMEYLRKYFDITLFYYNPNITDSTEYEKRIQEQKKLLEKYNQGEKEPIHFLEGRHEPEKFFQALKGMEGEKEGGVRCFACYELRLEGTAKEAKAGGFDFFTTTLSVSPHKNSEKLNEIGEKVGEKWGVLHLPSDFKKKNGYKRSTELSKEYELYRQNYCGCIYSKREAEKRWEDKKGNEKGHKWIQE